MPKRITILDPNGVEVTKGEASDRIVGWGAVVKACCDKLADEVKRENPKLGTYTVTVKEVE